MPEITEAKRTALTSLSGDEQLFQSSVRQFAREKIAPLVRKMDEEAVFDPGLLGEFFRLGWMGIEIPEAYGGAGEDLFHSILAIEEIAAVDPAAATIVDVQNTLVNNAVVRWGSEEQRKRYLTRLAKDTVGAYALSEAGSGSDAFAMSSVALDRGDHFLVRGRKLWITNAQESGVFLVFANAKPEAGYRGVTAFLIERGSPGFEVGRKEDKLGIRASSTCELLLEDCRATRENFLGKVGE